VNQPLNPLALSVNRLHDMPRACLVDLVEFRNAQRLGAARAMNYVGDILHGGTQAFRVAQGAGSHGHVRQVGFDKASIAVGAKDYCRRDAPHPKTIQDVAADKSVCPCEQDLHWLAGKNPSRWAGIRLGEPARHGLHQAKLPANLAELVQRKINLAVSMYRHEAETDQFLSGRHRRRHYRVDEHTRLFQALAELERRHQAAAIYRQDRCFGIAQVEAQRNQPLLHALGVAPELRDALGFREHDFQRGHDGGDVGGAHTGAENQRPRVVLQVINGFRIGCDEPTQARQRFAERAHDQLHLVGEAEMAGRPGAIFSKHADGVRVIHHHRGAVMIGQAAQFRQLDDVTLHAEHAVHYNEFARCRIDFPKAAFQSGHVLVGEPHEFAQRKLTALDDAGVIVFVGQNVFASSHERTDDAQIDLETSAVKQHRFLVNEPGEGLFQFKVDVQRPVQEARTSAGGAVLLDCGFGRFLDFRMIGQSEVAVRAEHQDFPAVDDDFAVLSRGNGAEVGVQPRLANLGGTPVIPDFVEQG